MAKRQKSEEAERFFKVLNPVIREVPIEYTIARGLLALEKKKGLQRADKFRAEYVRDYYGNDAGMNARIEEAIKTLRAKQKARDSKKAEKANSQPSHVAQPPPVKPQAQKA